MDDSFKTFSEGFKDTLNVMIAPATIVPEEGVQYWRERIFLVLVFSSAILGLFAFIPNVLISKDADIWSFIILYTLVYIFWILIFVFREIPFRLRVSGVLVIYYGLGIFTLLSSGIGSAGLIWLFAYPIFAGILLGLRSAILSIFINLITIIVLVYLINQGNIQSFSIKDLSVSVLIAGAGTFISLNAIVTISVAVLVSGLEATFKKEKQYKILLNEKQKKLTEAKERAEETDRLKTSFLTNMSHEFRTPMNAIIGYADLLNNSNISPIQREKYISIIKSSGKALVNLIDDIIDLSMIETHQIKITQQVCFINRLLDDFLHYYNQEKNKARKSILINLLKGESDENFAIRTDITRLNQIFTNLIGNAIKFTDEGFIEFGYSIEVINSEKFMQFYVRDTGIGIPYDKQTEIFNRFTKLEMDKNRLYRGTGLGLTISKQVVELLGGKMWLKSQIGKGTIFYFTIPYIRVEGSGQNISYRKNMNLNFNWENFTILIAEDEIDNYEFLKETLAPSKIKILWAKDGKQALLLCRSEEPDLVLMDIKMPVMDGYETTKNIRKFSKNLPIIAQTAFALPMDKEKFADAEFNDYITKPVNRYILLEIIDKYISLKSESYN